MPTKSEVLRMKRNAVMGGCCDRFADHMGCDCYELAECDSLELRRDFLSADAQKALESMGMLTRNAKPTRG